jgi:hypothetical protein
MDSASPDCERLRDLLPAYALGMTDAEEAQVVEELLPQCPEALPELEEYHELAGALLHSAPQVEPPPRVLTNLLAQIAAEPEDAPAQTTPAETPPARATPQAVMPPRRWFFPLTAAAAMVIVLLGVSVFSMWQLAELRAERDQLTQRMEMQTTLLGLFAAEDITTFELADARQEDGPARALVLCNLQSTVGLIRAENFPPLESDGLYQVWLLRDNERTSAGLLQIDETGRGMLLFEAPEIMGRYEYIGITPATTEDGQPAGPVVRGALYPSG